MERAASGKRIWFRRELACALSDAIPSATVSFPRRLMDQTIMVSGTELEFRGVGNAVPAAPPGIFRFLTCSGKGLIGRATGLPARSCRARLQIGARVASPQSSLSSTGAKGVFRVSVSLRIYRAAKGKWQFELIASGVPHDFSLGGQFRQCGADDGGANAAEFLQLLNRDRFLELSQSLTYPIHRC